MNKNQKALNNLNINPEVIFKTNPNKQYKLSMYLFFIYIVLIVTSFILKSNFVNLVASMVAFTAVAYYVYCFFTKSLNIFTKKHYYHITHGKVTKYDHSDVVVVALKTGILVQTSDFELRIQGYKSLIDAQKFFNSTNSVKKIVK